MLIIANSVLQYLEDTCFVLYLFGGSPFLCESADIIRRKCSNLKGNLCPKQKIYVHLHLNQKICIIESF